MYENSLRIIASLLEHELLDEKEYYDTIKKWTDNTKAKVLPLIIDYIQDEKKIKAISVYKTVFGVGLKEAKKAIDEIVKKIRIKEKDPLAETKKFVDIIVNDN